MIIQILLLALLAFISQTHAIENALLPTPTIDSSCDFCLVTDLPIVTFTPKPCAPFPTDEPLQQSDVITNQVPVFCRMASSMPYCLMLAGYEAAAEKYLFDGCPKVEEKAEVEEAAQATSRSSPTSGSTSSSASTVVSSQSPRAFMTSSTLSARVSATGYQRA